MIPVVVTIVYAFSFRLNKLPYSTVIYSTENQLLGAKIASDEQWRFPIEDSIPLKFKTCLIQFEDEHFFQHPGVNPFAIFRATFQNIKAGKIVSGGSTLTMQLVRIHRKKQRTFIEKFREILFALALELRFSKDEIIRQYAANAPFGGNTVGLTAASQRYFESNPTQLSWAESACLAVLPNAPSLLYPGKSSSQLLQKRNRLLKKLFNKKVIDSSNYELAIAEPLPNAAQNIPSLAPHLLQYAHTKFSGEQLSTNIKYYTQKRVYEIAQNYHQKYTTNKIYNLACIVCETKSGKVIAYLGNSPVKNISKNNYSYSVDLIQSNRSSGSILKPLLYMTMIDNGELLPQQLIPDIPTRIDNFSPQNFTLKYEGAVPADEALARSLNIPAVRILQDFRYQRFYDVLTNLGFSSLKYNADHYGLSLILGGAEVSLWDLAKVYSAMGRKLVSSSKTNTYITAPQLFQKEKKKTDKTLVLNVEKASIWKTFEALKEVIRPYEETGWKYFSNVSKIAWKTGTSYGNRDAWAVGVTPEYTIAVWVGNADGEGREGMTGSSYAAPIMFDIFHAISTKAEWFKEPKKELKNIEVCQESGYKPSPYCDHSKTISVPKEVSYSAICPYHQRIHLDQSESFQVNLACEKEENIKTRNWFSLPPLMEFYYQKKHPEYQSLPPFRFDCQRNESKVMEFVYPENNSSFFIPKGFNQLQEELIFQLSHSQRNTKIYWHIDGNYVKTTLGDHRLALRPTMGEHSISCVDELGNTETIHIRVLNKR